MKKRIMCVASFVFALLIMTISVSASVQASYLIERTLGSAAAVGNGYVTFSFHIAATDEMKDLGISKIEVYSESDGYLATFRYTDSGYSDMMGHNCSSYSGNVRFPGAPGERYYAVLTFYASDGNRSDTDTYTTNSVYAR